MRFLRNLSLLATLIFSPFLALPADYANLIMVEPSRRENPTVYLHFVGDAEFGALLRNTLIRCDWFKLVDKPEEAVYRLEASLADGKFGYALYDDDVVRASGGGSFSGNQRDFIYAQVNNLMAKSLRHFPVRLCGSRIAFVANTGKAKEIMTCNFDGSDVRQMTRNDTISTEPAWWPDSTMFAYTCYTGSTTGIVQYDVAGRRQRLLCKLPGLNSCPAISPDGHSMALSLSQDHQVDLYVMRIADQSLFRVTQDQNVEASPAWSPRMDQICFTSDKVGIGKPRLYLIAPSGGTATPLRPTLYVFGKNDRVPVSTGDIGASQVSPCWSPISNKIAYSVLTCGHYKIAIVDMSPAGSNAVDIFGDFMRRDANGYKALLLTRENGGNWEDPSWAPDGRHLVCTRNVDGRRTLWQLDSWYGTAMPIPGDNSDIDRSLPAWSGIMAPDPRSAKPENPDLKRK